MNLLDLSEISNGKLFGDSLEVNGFSIDTRTIQSKDVYIALRGENFDGHDFVLDAKEKGACAAVLERPIEINIPHLIVDDTYKFLEKVAIYNRRKFNGKLIGITGTNGKTSTKQMVANLLNRKGLCHKTIGNKNNQIGVPFTLLSLRPEHDFSVVEIGTSEPGEIEILSDMAQPHISAITNVSMGHLEGLKDTESIAKEKGNILNFKSNEGVAFLPRDSEFYEYWLENTNARETFSFGFHSESDFKVSNIKIDIAKNSTFFDLSYKNKIEKFSINGISQYNSLNASLSIAVALKCNVPITEIRQSLLGIDLPERRLNVSPALKGSILVDDTYNSNPASMKNALDSLENAKGQKICVMGSMKELGSKSKQIHKDVYNYAKKKVDMIFCMGEEWSGCSEDKNFKIFKNHEEIYKHIINIIDKNTIILVKGSRSTKMDKLADKLKP